MKVGIPESKCFSRTRMFTLASVLHISLQHLWQSHRFENLWKLQISVQVGNNWSGSGQNGEFNNLLKSKKPHSLGKFTCFMGNQFAVYPFDPLPYFRMQLPAFGVARLIDWIQAIMMSVLTLLYASLTRIITYNPTVNVIIQCYYSWRTLNKNFVKLKEVTF